VCDEDRTGVMGDLSGMTAARTGGVCRAELT